MIEHIEFNGIRLDTLDESTIAQLEYPQMRGLLNEAQLAVVNHGYVPSTAETANVVRLIINARRTQVQGNPRASAAAKANMDVKPAGLDDLDAFA